MQPSEGERTFLFTDVEGSTKLWERFPEGMRTALARHDEIMRQAARAHDGHVFKTIGDAFCVAFLSPEQAALAAIEAQRGLQAEDWGEVGAVKARMSLHLGTVEMRDNDYFGPTVNRVARLRDAGHGGQILITAAVGERIDRPGQPFTLLDMGEHGLKDLPEPQRLYQICAEGLPQQFATLRTLSTHPHNLPAETTAFVGRDRERAEVRALLTRENARLVTLSGFGGTGKTRLSLQVAEDVLAFYPEGVWFTDLSDLSDPALVLPAIARACGLEENPTRTALQLLNDHFRTAHTLLVLDNLEQVEEAAYDVAALLRGCAHLQILVTSRVLLNLSMEHEYEVPPLDVDDCVSLFAVRARQTQPSFAVTPENQAEVYSLCGRLDGHPLAVELAAAQVRSLSVGEIERALQQRLRTLSSKRRDLPPRHRSLRGAIDWSYDLLTPEEQRLFCTLFVFVGGFLPEAAETVCGESCHGREDTFDLLESLRDKSLVRQEREGRKRFSLLESLRVYAAERLAQEDAAAVQALREQHAAYYLEFAEEQEPLLREAGSQTEAGSALEVEAGNLRAGMDWMVQKGALDEAARYGVTLRRFWKLKGRLLEGRERLDAVARRAEGITDTHLHADLLYAAGFLWRDADSERAIRYYEESLRLSEELGDQSGRARTLNSLGIVAWEQGDLARANACYEESLGIARALGDQGGVAKTLNNLGLVSQEQGDSERAEALFAESLEHRRDLGDEIGEADVWHNLCVLAATRGGLAEARTAALKALALYEKVGVPAGKAAALINLGAFAAWEGELPAARRFLTDAQEILKAIEDTTMLAECLTYLGQVATQSGDHDQAIRLCHEALSLLEKKKDEKRIAYTLETLAEATLGQGRHDLSLLFLTVADALRDETGAQRLPYESERVARTRRAAGDAPDTAAPEPNPSLERAIQLAHTLIGDPRKRK